MGGGASSSSQPYDELGGQYASFSGGTPSPTFDWGVLGKGFQQTGGAIAGGAPQQNYMTGVGGFQPAAMQQAAPFDVGDQGMVIGTDKRIYDYQSLQSLVDALHRIDATELASPPRDFRPNPTFEYALPNVGGLYGTDEGQDISF